MSGILISLSTNLLTSLCFEPIDGKGYWCIYITIISSAISSAMFIVVATKLTTIQDGIKDTLSIFKNDDITTLYKKGWYPESLYLLAMVDYVSRINDVPLNNVYDKLRTAKLKDTLFPSGVIVEYAVTGNEKLKSDAIAASIPEFIKFNIVERNVRDVI